MFTPLACTTTLPEVAPPGTRHLDDARYRSQLVGVAAVPLERIVPSPWFAPKFVPAIVTFAVGAAAAGVRLVMARSGKHGKVSSIAIHARDGDGDAARGPAVWNGRNDDTGHAPCRRRGRCPVEGYCAAALSGAEIRACDGNACPYRPLQGGQTRDEGTTVKFAPLLFSPPALTTTLPVVATPAGT